MTDRNAFRPRLLLTRPRAGSERFARQFQARFGADWPITIAPLIEIEPTEAELPAANVLIITSEQAIAPVVNAPGWAGKPVYCVGPRTSEVLRRNGFEVLGTAPNAQQLFALISAEPDPGPMLHARGNESAFPLAQKLNAAGRNVQEAVVYAQVPQPPSKELQELLDRAQPLLVPVFSPNSGRLFAAAAEGTYARLRVAAISEAAAQACSGLAHTELRVAAKPSAEGLIDALVALMRDSSG
ncbi:uroporphyrinogen-III synthase [Rhodobacter aestuarii]|uniref:Uroporphyrinogen-III synthase n=1 Tax=Rhodobacter aestuarii TaxID=453582 RepID=A0A1N7LLG0_9RHOB|nr:uroporphyrinogen-III synthase [Rhodobacter aestuarii]PTV95179.1 uroporphyrinogen-III synthase [Rhodobacter aestuarii]SIS74619.1 uroporphyrinogen-III synthase [Rhodobacter aestuarii]